MKIFISADLEGVNGVVSPGDIIPGEPGYEASRVLMTEEVNAVVEGLFQGGATEITVCDSHEIAQNLRYDLLDERVSLISGATRDGSMVHSIDSSYDGLILLGHHAMFGTQNAVLDHTYDQYLIRELKVNGMPLGEFGLNSLVAAERGVPVIMTSGDDALEREAKAFCPDVEVAVVKKAEGRFCAKCLPKAESKRLLTDTACRAVSTIQERRCVEVPESPVLEITFQQTCMADGTMRVKDIKRTGPMTIEYACSSMSEVMDMRQVISDAAAEFFDRRF